MIIGYEYCLYEETFTCFIRLNKINKRRVVPIKPCSIQTSNSPFWALDAPNKYTNKKCELCIPYPQNGQIDSRDTRF